MTPRGHSNVDDWDGVYIDDPELGKVKIPISGGASVYTVKDLPPLYLSREEWEKIGKKAGWVK